MKDADAATGIIIDLAKTLIAEMKTMNVEWKQAFVRMQADEQSVQVKGSYVLPGEIQLFDVFSHRPMIRTFVEKARDLQEANAHQNNFFCVALLIVDASFNYEVKFEYKDPDRWAISKLNNASGYPVGLVPT